MNNNDEIQISYKEYLKHNPNTPCNKWYDKFSKYYKVMGDNGYVIYYVVRPKWFHPTSLKPYIKFLIDDKISNSKFITYLKQIGTKELNDVDRKLFKGLIRAKHQFIRHNCLMYFSLDCIVVYGTLSTHLKQHIEQLNQTLLDSRSYYHKWRNVKPTQFPFIFNKNLCYDKERKIELQFISFPGNLSIKMENDNQNDILEQMEKIPTIEIQMNKNSQPYIIQNYSMEEILKLGENNEKK